MTTVNDQGIDYAKLDELARTKRAGETWRLARSRLASTLVQPNGWRIVEERNDGRAWRATFGARMTVIESASIEDDGRRWHHVSVARPDRIPTWEELTAVKRAFIGEHREAYVVLPPASRYVNRHPFCLHLWACMDVDDGAILPDFSSGTSTI